MRSFKMRGIGITSAPLFDGVDRVQGGRCPSFGRPLGHERRDSCADGALGPLRSGHPRAALPPLWRGPVCHESRLHASTASTIQRWDGRHVIGRASGPRLRRLSGRASRTSTFEQACRERVMNSACASADSARPPDALSRVRERKCPRKTATAAGTGFR
jgi:hypothetical protein